MSESRRFLPLSLLAAAVLWGSGCDTLKARKTAQEGVAKYKDGDVQGAAELFDEAEAIDPSVPAIQINRGFAHMLLFQQSPTAKAGQKSSDIAVASFKKYIAMPISAAQRSRARDYLLQTLVDGKRYDDAVNYFRAQIDRKPPDVEALTILGNIAKSVGKDDEARRWLQMRVDNYPNDPDGFVALAVLDWDDLCNDSECRKPPDQKTAGAFAWPKQRRIETANHGIELVKKAAALSPNAPTPLTYWNLLLRERQFGYEPAFTNPKNPNDPKALAELERVNKLKKDDLDEAQKKMLQAMELMKSAKGENAEKK